MRRSLSEHLGTIILLATVVILVALFVIGVRADNRFIEDCADNKGVIFRRYPAGGLICVADYRIINKR